MASPPTATYTIHKSLSELIDRYDGFILDQFGVMHNGVAALPGAADCVHRLQHQKRLVILSNSSSLAASTMTRLPTLGLDANDFLGAVTSGQEASQFVRDKYGTASSSNGKSIKALFFTWQSSSSSSQTTKDFLQACGSNIQATVNVDEADFVLLHGSQVLRDGAGDNDGSPARETPLGFFETGDLSKVEPILKLCKERNLEIVCCNPDYIYVSPDGTIKHMPGTIADVYQTKYAGTVHSFGKPHVAHFEACIRMLNLPKDRIAHVGDSLLHDVKGANDAGVASIFVTHGVHRDELGIQNDGDVPTKPALDELFAKHGHVPTHVVPMFQY